MNRSFYLIFSLFLLTILTITLYAGKMNLTPQEILKVKCSKCHATPDPAKYSEEKWHKFVKMMSSRAKLTPEEQKKLLELK